MKTIENYKKEQLIENYYNAIGYTYSEWLNLEAENDPNFFRWLFDEECIDSISDLSDDQRAAWDEFLAGVQGRTLGDYANHFCVDTEDESFLFPVRKAGDYYWLTGEELEKLWDKPAIRVWYEGVTDTDRWEPRGGDVDVEKDFEWVKLADESYIGLF